ncbi:hypothetical protein EK904_012456, partial [Melospiza melodia maxima]
MQRRNTEFSESVSKNPVQNSHISEISETAVLRQMDYNQFWESRASSAPGLGRFNWTLASTAPFRSAQVSAAVAITRISERGISKHSEIQSRIRVLMTVHFLLVPSLMSILGAAQYVMQDAALLSYIDQRFLSLERRLEKCSQDLLEYVDEFRELSKAALARLARLSTDKAELKGEVENLLTRVERAQRDIDYFGSLTDSNACVEVHEDLLKQQLLEEAEEKKRLKLMLNASCDHMLAGIRSLKVVKKTGGKHGSWMKDPGKKHAKIYLLSGSVNNVVLEFANIMAFMENNQTLKARRVPLPVPWEGNGHHSWDTPCSSRDAEAAFMACNTLHVVYNSPSGGSSRIQCVYDVLGALNAHTNPGLHFPKRQGGHSSVHYNPKEKQLFAWGDGSQIIYKLHTEKKWQQHLWAYSTGDRPSSRGEFDALCSDSRITILPTTAAFLSALAVLQ